MKVLKAIFIALVALSSLASCAAARLLLEDGLGQAPSRAAGGSLNTNLSDAYPAAPYVNHTYEVKNEQPKSVESLPTDKNGFRILRPGFYYKAARSYCLHAAAYGPRSGGNGYLLAPAKGTDAAILKHLILVGEHEGVSQQKVQADIWAVEGGGFDYVLHDFEVARLLGPEDLLWLKARSEEKKEMASAASIVENHVPSGVQRLLDARQRFLNSLNSFADGAISYDELARAAVLTGEPPHDKADRIVPTGQWALVPEGYYVRAFPDSYASTRLEFYVPRPVKWVYDRLGRPRSATDETTGFRIDYEYYGETVFVTPPGYPYLKAYPFKSVKVTLPASLSSVGKIAFIWKNHGFILVGPLKPLLERHAQDGTAAPEPLGIGPKVLLADSSNSKSDADPIAGAAAKLALQDTAKLLQAGIPWEDTKTIGKIGSMVLDGVEVYGGLAAADELSQPNVSEIDKARAGMELVNSVPAAVELAGELTAVDIESTSVVTAQPGLPSPFAVPLALANIMISEVTDLWNEASNALAGGLRGKREISHPGVEVPGNKHAQRLGIVY